MNNAQSATSSKVVAPSDRALNSADGDKLGRRDFAWALAEAIYRYDAGEGFVVGLSGPWGNGKSSVKNMVLERLRGFGAQAPDVLEFNPWQFSGQDQITAVYFEELLTKISKSGQNNNPEKTKQRAETLAKYGAYVSMTSTAVKTAGALVPFLSVLGTAGDAAAGALKQGAEAMAARAKDQAESLSDLKNRLRAEFASLERPLLVVIDDIDRLNAQEIPLLFQLVKANADFPQVIYLLLYEKITVENALGKISDGRGKEFLEKIIQVSFDLPIISQRRIDQVLFAGILEVLGEATIKKRWDKTRWTNFYPQHLQRYFSNLRAVNRFLASFTLQVALLRGNEAERALGNLEVNPIDLIALECLRIFESGTLYGRLFNLRSILTRRRDKGWLPVDIGQDEVDKLVEGIVESVPAQDKSTVKALILSVFPPVGPDHAKRGLVSMCDDEWFREMRVCHPGYFDRYFQLSLAEDEMSQGDLDRLLSSLANRDEAYSELLSLRDRGHLITAIDRLNHYAKTLEPAHVHPAVLAMCDLADDLPEETEEDFFDTPTIRAWRFCYWTLLRVEGSSARASVLLDIITRSRGLSLPLRIVSMDCRGDDSTSGNGDLFEAADVEQLKEACANRCKKEATENLEGFSRREDMGLLLWTWRKWGNDTGGTQSWINQLVETDGGIFDFLYMCLGRSISPTTICWHMNLSSVEKYIPISEVESKLVGVDADKLDAKARIAFRCFKWAMQDSLEGKVWDQLHRDEREQESLQAYQARLNQFLHSS